MGKAGRRLARLGRMSAELAQALAGLVRVHLGQPGSRTMAVLLGAGVVVSLLATSCQWPGAMAPARRGVSDSWRGPGVWVGVEPTIAVRIAEPSKELVLAGARLVLVRSGSMPARVLRTPVLVRAEQGHLVLAEAGGRSHTLTDAVDVTSADPRPPEHALAQGVEGMLHAPRVAVQGVAYPGLVRLTAHAGGVQAVNHLPLEQYVAAVASRELYPSWAPAAFEAQCIAARSYAMQSMALAERSGRPWHVESGTIDQAYPGHTTNRRAIEAALRTAGWVLTWQGRVLRAYYSSTSGGRSASAADTWPTGPGFEYNLARPIQAHRIVHASDASPRHRWQVVRTSQDVTARLRAWGQRAGHSLKNAREVTNIQVLRTNAVGRPSAYRVGEANGLWHEVSAEQLRVALNSPASGLPAVDGASRIPSGDLEVLAAGERLVFRGRGFGHGVGMCQFSAQALAERGWSAQEIVRNFYPGATLERAY